MKIYNTLEKADIPFEDIQNLKTFTSREGFMLVDDEEYEELQKFFQQFSLFNGLVRYFLTAIPIIGAFLPKGRAKDLFVTSITKSKTV